MESEVDTNDAGKEEGQRIVIKWSRSKGGNVKRGKDFATAQGTLNAARIKVALTYFQ